VSDDVRQFAVDVVHFHTATQMNAGSLAWASERRTAERVVDALRQAGLLVEQLPAPEKGD
jgi:hypothetical protein